ncbi:MAG: hypothetical protein ACLU3I_00310 [Acutalibacteraceae bacterium]
MLSDEEIDYSILAKIGGAIAWIFAPLGWGNWQAARRLHHRPRRQGEHRRHARHPLWRRRRHGLSEPCYRVQWHHRLLLPGLQPPVRSVLRGHRRHQA